jgi:hypothetical protein
MKISQDSLDIEYSDEIGTDSEAKWHLIRRKTQSEKSERSDAGNLLIT